MLQVTDLAVTFGDRTLYKDVNLKFMPGNCYGLIGANGAGKSTFLKVLSGEIDASRGDISIGKGERLAVLSQDQFAFDEHSVIDAVIMGHKRLYEVLKERDEIYMKADFTEEDGMRAANLETEFAELGGYEAEAEAGQLLEGLGITSDLQEKMMSELEASQKVRVLLAQALFGNPDIMLLDEPTNQLDLETVRWLEDFLMDFKNTVIVVSHDRHFLNNVCTHIADIDFNKISLYVGNYDFWYHASQLAQQQRKNLRLKNEDKVAQLKAFILRFSSNRSKARQATSRRKLIDKLTLDDMPASSRKFPYVDFKPNRLPGNVILEVLGLTHAVDGVQVFKDYNFNANGGDKIAFLGNDIYKTAFFDIIAGETEPQTGDIRWGATIQPSYFPKNHDHYFEGDEPIIDWLRQYSSDKSDTFVRGFLGRMLFTGDEVFKSVRVLSGGEKVRCMLSKMMLEGANALVMDEPTNHLDLEAITSLNDGLINFPGVVLFTTPDQEFIETVANRIIEFTPNGIIDRYMSFEEYINRPDIMAMRAEMYAGDTKLVLT
jgi:ATPase subunit of ABC transporter with duplicated ATPase domains